MTHTNLELQLVDALAQGITEETHDVYLVLDEPVHECADNGSMVPAGEHYITMIEPILTGWLAGAYVVSLTFGENDPQLYGTAASVIAFGNSAVRVRQYT